MFFRPQWKRLLIENFRESFCEKFQEKLCCLDAARRRTLYWKIEQPHSPLRDPVPCHAAVI
ncbi:hypothetical protein BN2475_190113 [Paraburkholderia ribeironis]|uniref:Uncharacterized protein n=1 Tax=Paraburkholderia ribeironis TaxID=1247936 RepID=A0A1N7RVP5_9BURK|nr:hypothetical protein BN2475_190113 [Paraburkholderia ribeironis]